VRDREREEREMKRRSDSKCGSEGGKRNRKTVAKMHRIPYLLRSIFTKEPYNWWLFWKKRPAT